MALRILTGVLVTERQDGTATIHFNPHDVTGQAEGVERSQTGSGGDFMSRPGKILSIRQFHFFDSDSHWGGDDSRERFNINDDTWDRDKLEVTWSSKGSSRIQEISYLIVGVTREPTSAISALKRP